MFDEYPFEQDICALETGDLLYIFSDGVYEVPQANSKLWGFDNLVKLLAKDRNSNNFNLEKIWRFIQKQHREQILDDDFSLLKITL